MAANPRNTMAEASSVAPAALTPRAAPRTTIATLMNHSARAPSGSELQLTAENLQLGDGADEDGLAFSTIDGWERAYVFRVTFARQGGPITPREETEPSLRLVAPHFAQPGPQLLVTLEVDHAPDGASVEVSLGRFLAGVFEPVITEQRATDRRRRLGFALQPGDGALAFEAAVKDRVVPLNASNTVGRREIRARLLDRGGVPLQAVYQTIVLDDSAPENRKFVDPPRLARRDAPLTLQASGASTVSEIAQVFFFLGKPVDDKVPPNTPTLSGQPVDRAKAVWSAALPLVGDRRGPTEVSAQFVNAVGRSAFAIIVVDLIDNDQAKVLPGSIAVTVNEGDIAPPNLDVILKDEKGVQKDKKKTDTAATVTFENVTPGKYTVSCHKSSTQRKGEAKVTVEGGKPATARIKLKR